MSDRAQQDAVAWRAEARALLADAWNAAGDHDKWNRAAHLYTPFIGIDGILVDFYIGRAGEEGVRLMRETGPLPATAALLARRMGCQWEEGVLVLVLELAWPAGKAESTRALVDFIGAAVALAVAGDLLASGSRTVRAMTAAPALFAEFEDGSTVEVTLE